jgi:hypothetical protein
MDWPNEEVEEAKQNTGIVEPAKKETKQEDAPSEEEAFEQLGEDMMQDAPQEKTETPSPAPEPEKKEEKKEDKSPETQTTAVEAKPEQALSTEINMEEHFIDGKPRGSVDMDAGALNTPRWAIVQGISDIAKTHPDAPGKIYFSMNDTLHKKVEFLVIDFKLNRRMFEPFKDEKGNKIKDRSTHPLCYSDTGQLNDGGVLHPALQSVRCSECPHSKWKESEQPACTIFHNYLVISVEQLIAKESLPSILACSKSQTRETKKFNTELNSKMVSYKGASVRAPYYFNVYSLESIVSPNNPDVGYIPVFNLVRSATAEEINACLQISKQFESIEWASLREG